MAQTLSRSQLPVSQPGSKGTRNTIDGMVKPSHLVTAQTHGGKQNLECETNRGIVLTETQLSGSTLSSPAARPSIADAKFATEMPKRRVSSPDNPQLRRIVSDNHELESGMALGDSASSDSSEWSSDEDDIRKQGGKKTLLTRFRMNRGVRAPSKGNLKREVHQYNDDHHELIRSRTRRGKDGRLAISVNDTANSGLMAKSLGNVIRSHLHPQEVEEEAKIRQMIPDYLFQYDETIPKLNIVVMVIGSRGDIQPFLKIGKILKEEYGHRVRIATHPTFRKFVEQDIGLEFFSVGGDPSELMAFMVKNPGLIPSLKTIKEGEVGRRRDSMFEMFQGFWRACINGTDDETDTANLKMMGDNYPFIADAIIANPPSFAHYHCAEKLGIPLHLVFTFPYTPTESFPHPLANIKAGNVDQSYTNFMSYPLVDLMTWQGLGDLVNQFRTKTLGLDPISALWAPGQVSRMRVPMTYLFSPGLVPKPKDWGDHIDIAGYVFLDLASSFKPDKALLDFLSPKDGTKFAYIGFGSISGLTDPKAFTQMIFDAVELAGVRAVVSRGWGGMGDGLDVPDSVYLIDNVPHDWLFPQMDCVIHHGGAGTTAIGLKCGKPTMIVPFFGDQPFWSAMIVKAGAGAKQSLPLKKLNAERFAEGIKQCLSPEAKEAAEGIAKSIAEEGDGALNAVHSFHASLPLNIGLQVQTKDKRRKDIGAKRRPMRCCIFPDRAAVWHVTHTRMRLSPLAAELLTTNGKLTWKDLELARHQEWTDFRGPGEPITGAAGAALASLQDAVKGLIEMRHATGRDIKRLKRARQRANHKSIYDAVVVPGQISHAIHGTNTIETRKDEFLKMRGRVNLEGEGQPSRLIPEDDYRRAFEDEDDDEGGGKKQSNGPRLSLHLPHKKGNANTENNHNDKPNATPKSKFTSNTTTTTNMATLARQHTKPSTARRAIARDLAHGTGHTLKAAVLIPWDINYAIALGMRNAPRLYGDRTVRRPPRVIKGLGDGLQAAGQEFVGGIWDGVVGVVRGPVVGWKEGGRKRGGNVGGPGGVAETSGGAVDNTTNGNETNAENGHGVDGKENTNSDTGHTNGELKTNSLSTRRTSQQWAGFSRGVVQGLGGLVLKPVAGTLGVTAYTEQGIRMEVRKRLRDTRKTERFVRRARRWQGGKDVRALQGEAGQGEGGEEGKEKIISGAKDRAKEDVEEKEMRKDKEAYAAAVAALQEQEETPARATEQRQAQSTADSLPGPSATPKDITPASDIDTAPPPTSGTETAGAVTTADPSTTTSTNTTTHPQNSNVETLASMRTLALQRWDECSSALKIEKQRKQKTKKAKVIDGIVGR